MPSASRIWVHGVRITRDPNHWKAVSLILQHRFAEIIPRATTLEAETGLGIPRSFYWYVSCVGQAFAGWVFFFSVEDAKWSTDERGSSPFDTGGLWHGFVNTRDKLSETEKKALFDRYDRTLIDGAKSFNEYLTQNYDSIEAYVRGRCPRIGVPEFDYGSKPGATDERAWTWEARVRLEIVGDNVRMWRVYSEDSTVNAFAKLIENDPAMDLSTSSAVVRRLLGVLKRVSPIRGVYEVAAEDLIEGR